jgi:hypothetical protein
LLFPGDGVLELQVVKNIDDFTIEFEDGVIETHDIWGSRVIVIDVTLSKPDQV